MSSKCVDDAETLLIVANTDQAVDTAEVALWAELLAVRDKARGKTEGMEGVVGREVGGDDTGAE